MLEYDVRKGEQTEDEQEKTKQPTLRDSLGKLGEHAVVDADNLLSVSEMCLSVVLTGPLEIVPPQCIYIYLFIFFSVFSPSICRSYARLSPHH